MQFSFCVHETPPYAIYTCNSVEQTCCDVFVYVSSIFFFSLPRRVVSRVNGIGQLVSSQSLDCRKRLLNRAITRDCRYWLLKYCGYEVKHQSSNRMRPCKQRSRFKADIHVIRANYKCCSISSAMITPLYESNCR